MRLAVRMIASRLSHWLVNINQEATPFVVGGEHRIARVASLDAAVGRLVMVQDVLLLQDVPRFRLQLTI
jgi:hypothetical protein